MFLVQKDLDVQFFRYNESFLPALGHRGHHGMMWHVACRAVPGDVVWIWDGNIRAPRLGD